MDDFARRYVHVVAGLPWPVLDQLTKELGRPTEGFVAEAVWQKCQQTSTAREHMHRMGYKCSKRWPLQLKGDRAPDDKARFLALEAAKQEIEENGPYLERVAEIMNPPEKVDAAEEASATNSAIPAANA